jgi:hypothetical protein
MKTRLYVWMTLMVVSLLLSVMPARSEITTIAIRGADAATLHTVATSPDRTSLQLYSEPGFSIQSANSNRCDLLGSLDARLGLLLEAVPCRIIIGHADANSVRSLHYPNGMLKDRLSPLMSDLTVRTGDNEVPDILWTTNEYAQSTIHCGKEIGAFSLPFSGTLYTKNHRITLAELERDSTYFCRACSTDIEGNISTGTGFRIRRGEQFLIPFPMDACP